METYTALQQSANKRDYKKQTIAFGIFVTVLGIIAMDPLLLIIGPVLVYIMLYKKVAEVNSEGIIMHYHAIFYNKTKFYDFKEFEIIRAEATNGTERTLNFVRKGMSYPMLFPYDISERVMEMAMERHPEVVIQHYVSNRRRRLRF